jgi:hypothetical protein
MKRVMYISFRSLSVFLLLFAAPMGSLYAQESLDQPRDVEVRLFLVDVESVDTVAQKFTANLTIVMRWHDASLAHDGPDSISMPLDNIWYPRIQALNRQKVTSTLPPSVEVQPDGEVIRRQHFWGNFSQPLDLNLFPFDSQRLKISVANVDFGKEVINLIASPESGVSKQLSMTDWKVTGWNFIATDLSLDDESSSIQGVIFSLDVKRDTSFFIFKVILPLVLIVMMSWLVFWIDPTLAASQISVSVTAMLTMIAYRFALAGMMPRLNFLTSLDYFVLASTLVVFLSMTEVVYTAYLSTNNQLEKARKIDRGARWIAPLIFSVMAAETLYFRVLV